MASTINADNGVVSGSSGVKTTADTSGVLALQSNGSTGVTLDTSLNVGVGTTSPVEKLTVAGSVSSSSEFVIKSGTTAKFALGQTSDAFYIYSNAAGTERLVVNSSGNVGIGTSSPGSKLDVYGTVRTTLAADSSYYGVFTNSGGATQLDARGSGATLQLLTGGTQRFLVGPSGQLGIGGATYGTSGQVLTSGGSGAAPTWETPGGGAGAFVAFGSTGGF